MAGAVDNGLHEELAVWRLSPSGALDTDFAQDGVFVLPGRGRATNALVDGDGVIIGGWHFTPESGTDAVLLRFEP